MSYIFLVPGNDFVFSVFAFVTSFVKKVAKLGCAAELREHPSSSPKLSVNRRVSGTGNFHGSCVVSHAKKSKCAAVAGSHTSKKPGPGAALVLALAVTEQVTSLH